MGVVDSIKGFINGGDDFDDSYVDYEDYEEYADDEEPVTRHSPFGGRFQSRKDDRREQSYLADSNDISIIKVRKYDDATAIADVLKERRPVIFDVIEMEKSDEAEKVVNFMVGAVYAVDGNIKRISGGIFIATPRNMRINSDEIRKKTGSAFGINI